MKLCGEFARIGQAASSVDLTKVSGASKGRLVSSIESHFWMSRLYPLVIHTLNSSPHLYKFTRICNIHLPLTSRLAETTLCPLPMFQLKFEMHPTCERFLLTNSRLRHGHIYARSSAATAIFCVLCSLFSLSPVAHVLYNQYICHSVLRPRTAR